MSTGSSQAPHCPKCLVWNCSSRSAPLRACPALQWRDLEHPRFGIWECSSVPRGCAQTPSTPSPPSCEEQRLCWTQGGIPTNLPFPCSLFFLFCTAKCCQIRDLLLKHGSVTGMKQRRCKQAFSSDTAPRSNSCNIYITGRFRSKGLIPPMPIGVRTGLLCVLFCTQQQSLFQNLRCLGRADLCLLIPWENFTQPWAQGAQDELAPADAVGFTQGAQDNLAPAHSHGPRRLQSPPCPWILGHPRAAAPGTASSGEGDWNAFPMEELPFGRVPQSSPGYIRAQCAVGYW